MEPRFIPSSFVEVVKDRLEGFNKRAAKKGLPVQTIVTGKKEMRKEHTSVYGAHHGEDACPSYEWTEVSIVGDKPVIGPWELIAAIDNVGGKPFFRPVPDMEVPESFRDTDPLRCDYCQKRIATRLETFIVHNTVTGDYKQVGRQCIRDFLGWDVAALTNYWSMFKSLMDEPDGGWGSYVKPEFRPLDIIDLAARIVAVDGRYFKSVENERSTKSKVMEFLFPPRDGESLRWFKEEFVPKYNSQPELSKRILDLTVTALDGLNNPNNDWLYNIQTCWQAEWIGIRQIGVLASAVILGLRQIEDELKPKTVASEFVGKVGEKVTGRLTIDDVRTFNGDFGYNSFSVLLTTHDEAGNKVKWFTSTPYKYADYSDLVELIGQTMTFTGKVKKHEEYKGVKSTVLNYVKKDA